VYKNILPEVRVTSITQSTSPPLFLCKAGAAGPSNALLRNLIRGSFSEKMFSVLIEKQLCGVVQNTIRENLLYYIIIIRAALIIILLPIPGIYIIIV